jgi:hypothetical protein
MIDHLLSAQGFSGVSRMQGRSARELTKMDPVGRLVQITLAIYLMLALMAVVIVSGVGMMVLGVSETVHGLSKRSR